jgi:2'-5' RNA ligase
MPERRKNPSIRAFVALDLDPVSVRRVARISDRLRMGSGAPSATWTRPEKFHLTLKFIGELPLDGVAWLAKALAVLAVGKNAPRPGTFRLDAFPSVEEAEIVVAVLQDPFGDLRMLALALDEIASKHGCPTEARPFRPHVTLARLKRPYDTRRWLRPELAEGADECRVTAVTLYRSDVSGEGVTYVPLARREYARGG